MHYAVDESYNTFNVEKMEKIFDGKKTAKLGTEKNPAVVNVQTEERVKELESVFEENGWKYTIELEPDKPEDITDLEILLNPLKSRIAKRKWDVMNPAHVEAVKSIKKFCGKKVFFKNSKIIILLKSEKALASTLHIQTVSH